MKRKQILPELLPKSNKKQMGLVILIRPQYTHPSFSKITNHENPDSNLMKGEEREITSINWSKESSIYLGSLMLGFDTDSLTFQLLFIYLDPAASLWKMSGETRRQGGGFVQKRALQDPRGRRRRGHLIDHLWGWSELATPEGLLLPAPFSEGGGAPHWPSDSSGSRTQTPPSVRPRANWFASDGCAAMHSGYTLILGFGGK